MKSATLLHNPKAGDEANTRTELLFKIKTEGFECNYSPLDQHDWNEINEVTDFLIIAGGDGTVRNAAIELLEKQLNQKYPIALLPIGTANNIAKTLGISAGEKSIIQSWHQQKLKKFDVGRIISGSYTGYFLESFGYGVFPLLMQVMKKQDKQLMDSPEKKMNLALKLLQEIITTYSAPYCDLEIDGKDYAGNYLLMEIMNTKAIGPNLVLSPHGDPGDGQFEVVMIPEQQKEKFLLQVFEMFNGTEQHYKFDLIKGKNIKLNCTESPCHVDDELINLDKGEEINIQLMEGMFTFLVQ